MYDIRLEEFAGWPVFYYYLKGREKTMFLVRLVYRLARAMQDAHGLESDLMKSRVRC